MKPTQSEILAGGTVVDNVKVRLVPMRRIDELGNAWMDEGKEIAVYTDLTAEEIDQLTPEQWGAIIKEGRRLNFTRFSQWRDRRVAVGNAMMAAEREASASASSSSSAKDTGSPTS